MVGGVWSSRTTELITVDEKHRQGIIQLLPYIHSVMLLTISICDFVVLMSHNRLQGGFTVGPREAVPLLNTSINMFDKSMHGTGLW